LELHVAAVVCPLQLDDYKAGLAIKAEEVDPAIAVLPFPELLRDHHEVVTEDADISAK
jgi:hypothetical protein